MKLVIPRYGISITLPENQVSILTVENPEAYAWIVGDLWRQCNGQAGEIILSEIDEPFKISSKMELIFNPYGINCNERKVLSKLYSEIQTYCHESFEEKFMQINSEAISLLEKLFTMVSYPMTIQYEMNFEGLLKLFDAKIDIEKVDIATYMLEYMKIKKKILKVDVFVIINLKQFLSDEELMELYKSLWYEKIFLVILEGVETRPCISGEKRILLDYDLCIIET